MFATLPTFPTEYPYAWVGFALTVQELLETSLTGDENKPAISAPPSAKPPFKLPLVPTDYKDLKKILEKIRDLMKHWPWKKIIEKYDRDGDGTLSPDELKESFRDRIPCVAVVLPCDKRDELIDQALCYFLRGPYVECDLEGIEISPELIEDWFQRWLESVEWQINVFCQEDSDPERCEFFKDLKKLLEDLRKKFREGVPCPPPVRGCDCGCSVDCPGRQPAVDAPPSRNMSGTAVPSWK